MRMCGVHVRGGTSGPDAQAHEGVNRLCRGTQLNPWALTVARVGRVSQWSAGRGATHLILTIPPSPSTAPLGA